MSKHDHDCRNCGAPRSDEADVCPYCGTLFPDVAMPAVDAPYARPIVPGGAKPSWDLSKAGPAKPSFAPGTAGAQIVTFAVLMLFCSPVALIYMWSRHLWTHKTRVIVTAFLAGWWAFTLLIGLTAD